MGDDLCATIYPEYSVHLLCIIRQVFIVSNYVRIAPFEVSGFKN